MTAMSRAQVAKALGMSRTWVEVIERRALAKMACALGGDAPVQGWVARHHAEAATTRRCKRCGGEGHCAKGCVS